MTIHAYYGDYSGLKNERAMFDDLLTQLKLNWQYNDQWIYVFYNTMWSGQEIDVVVFTQNSIVVIDLKNYSGTLDGAENGEWLMNSSIKVLGGSQINPFVQVRKNKFAVIEWFKSVGIFTQHNLGHTAGCIIFNELTQKHIEVSTGVKKWFYVTDIAHAADVLATIQTPGINLAKDDMEYLLGKLKLKSYIWDDSKPPRDIKYHFEENVIPQAPDIIQHQNLQYSSNWALKNTISKQVEYQSSIQVFSYILFVVTLAICITISFLIALEMKSSGGISYIFKNFFGR